ncbi:MAG: pseudouridine synthase [Terracidiphilus sp.]|jgi:23S rRNA pseudouridine2605 synthase
MAKKKSKLQPESTPIESPATESAEPILETASEPEIPKIQDPIGDETDGEARTAIEPEPEPKEAEPESKSETEIGAEDSPEVEGDSEQDSGPEDDSRPEFTPKPRPPAKPERLQKILAAAGIASRRSAETLIEQGRVQVNGKVVTILGTKADLGRDHIRVDGKLLQGAERLRYFILNKPRGFVTTVKDPEGRPTVMQFFEKMKERLYPVGRLDYMSEGLLVVTNDGELANRLTKASSGVEKTYLVKVAGQPTEAELDILRGGVAIERGKPGSSKVRTSPARIRQVRQGDNPWYEVVLIEGRNRELRKMFEEVGHFVEKIRRTGYGPLVLDQEPGQLRELEPRELELLRQAAEGKLRTPKSKDIRRRNLSDAGLLPTVLPKPSGRPRQPVSLPAVADRPAAYRPNRPGPERPGSPARPSRPAGAYSKNAAPKPFRPDRPRPDRAGPSRGGEGFRPSAGRTSAPNPVRSFSHNEDEAPGRRGDQANFGSARPSGRSFDRPAYDRPSTGPARPASAGTDRPATGRPFTAKPKFDKPAWKKPERTERAGKPAFQRSAPPRREAPARPTRDFDDDLGPVRPPNLHIEEIPAERPGPARPYRPRPFEARNFEPRSGAPRTSSSRPSAPRPYSDRPNTSNRPSRPSSPSRPGFARPASSEGSSSARSGPPKPFRGEGGLARPFTTSSGKPRAGGARPSSKPGGKFSKSGSSKPGGFKPYGAKPGGRSSAGPARRSFSSNQGEGSFAPRPAAGSGSSTSSRPFAPRTEGASDYHPTKAKPYPSSTSRADRKAGPGWKPRPGAPTDRSSSVGRKPGGFKSSGYKGKPSGPKRSGPPSGGKRFGSKPGGKKRG